MPYLLKNDNKICLNRDKSTFKLHVDTTADTAYFSLQCTVSTSFVIDWGDGYLNSVTIGTSLTQCRHPYAQKGVYPVTLQGDFTKIKGFNSSTNGATGGVTGGLSDDWFLMNLTDLRIFGSQLYQPNGELKLKQGTQLSYVYLAYVEYVKDLTLLISPSVSYISVNYCRYITCNLTSLLNPTLSTLGANNNFYSNFEADFAGKSMPNLTSLQSYMIKVGSVDFSLMPALTSVSMRGVTDINSTVDITNFPFLTATYLSTQGSTRVVGNVTGKVVNPAIGTCWINGDGVAGDMTNFFTGNIRTGQKVIISNNVTGDISNWNFNRTDNWYPQVYNIIEFTCRFYGSIANMKIPYSGIPSLILRNNHLTGLDGFVSGIFDDRLLISTANQISINIAGQTDKNTGTPITVTGTYTAGSIAPYTGSIHDLTEAQITEVSASWAARQKVWWLVNAQISSINTTKRYKYSITV